MKKHFIALFLTITLLFCTCAPSVQCFADASKASVFKTERELIYYEETRGMRVSIELFKSGSLICSAYFDEEPDAFYEYKTSAEDFDTNDPDWTQIKRSFFDNRTSWIRRCVSAEIQTEECDDSLIWSANYDGDYVYTINGLPGDTTYFTQWLQSHTHASPFRGEILSTGFYQGFMLYNKIGLDFIVSQVRNFSLSGFFSVVQLIVSVLLKSATDVLVNVISLLLDSADDLFQPGTRVLVYSLKADWFKYVTFGSAPGYPYAKADKYITWTGYGYSQTGNFNVDVDSETTTYDPSATKYNQSPQSYFSDAYTQYTWLGMMTGDY